MRSNALRALPGFDWTRVRWGGPEEWVHRKVQLLWRSVG